MNRATVPKAAINKDSYPGSGECDIRPARKVNVYAIPQSSPPESGPEKNFRLRVPAFDTRHAAASLRFGHYVGHVLALSCTF